MFACVTCFLVCFGRLISFRKYTPSLAHAACRARTPTTVRRPATAAALRPARRPLETARPTREPASSSVLKW
eukprot:1596465-Pleurochrysis_carterae.AAC.1